MTPELSAAGGTPELSAAGGTPDLLTVRDLSVAFPTESGLAQVLDRVSLSLRPGEIMGLVGESGCGKTTLARAILGALPPGAIVGAPPTGARTDHGAIEFEGQLLAGSAGPTSSSGLRGRAITFIPQDPLGAFSPLFTIGAQIAEQLRWNSPSGNRRERTLEMLRAVQLPDPAALLRKYPHELSGGQRQRVMIAMALLPEPRLVIADEPTTALDVTIQAQILKLLRRLATERGAGVLFTTHDLGAAWEICDRVTVMYAGQEAESADVAGFFARPAHPYTRMLLDSLPTSGAALKGIPGAVPNPTAPPTGCRFHPRCPRATAVCAERQSPVRVVAPGHAVRCHHPL